MKKEDLKTGMIVETRECSKFMVIKDAINSNGWGDVIANEDTFHDLNNLADDLSYTGFRELDIIKVYTSKTRNPIFSMRKKKLDIIWERKEQPQLTERERAYLKAYSYDYEWIARDDDDCLTFFKEKPVKKTNGWYIGYIFKTDNLCIKDLFSFIKWEDEEPYRIKDLLEEE